jgi:hypothetical protein
MKLPAIVAELAAVYHEDAFDENRGKYWWYEIKLHRSDLSDRPSSSWRYQCSNYAGLGSWAGFSIRTIAESLEIPASTVHFYLTTSLNMKSRHLNRVRIFLDDDLRAKRLEGARQPHDVLKAPERCHFRDLIIRNETLVDFDMKPGAI